MNIYVCKCDYRGYDTYDGFVVVAESEENAKEISIKKGLDKKTLSIKLVGITHLYEEQVLLGSFNAG